MTNGRYSRDTGVEQRAETKKKREDLHCLLNRLVEPLWEFLELLKQVN